MRHVNSMTRRPVLLGRTRSGAPIWSIAGGAGDDTGDADTGDDTGDDIDTGDEDDVTGVDTGDEDGDDDAPLGPKGQKALEAMKKRARAAERENRRLKAERSRSRNGDGDDGQGDDDDGDAPDPKKIREQVTAELRAEAARERVLDKLEVHASKAKGDRPPFANPELARQLLKDEADDFLDDQGKPDVEAINERLAELLEDEPYLAAQGSKWQGGGDGGPRKTKTVDVEPGLGRLRHAYESTSK